MARRAAVTRALLLLVTAGALLAAPASAKTKPKPKPKAVVEVGVCGQLSNSGRARSPLVRMGPVTVVGALDKEIVRRVVRRRFAQLSYCYEKALQVDPQLAGTLQAKLTIGADGKVATATVSGIGNADVEGCVRGRLGALEFPKPTDGASVQASFAIILSAGDEVRAYAATLRAELAKHTDGVRACYETGLAADPGLAGLLEVTLGLDEDGVLSGAEAKGLGDNAVHECVGEALEALTWPKSPVNETYLCTIALVPLATELWSLDKLVAAGPAVVRVDATTATLDGKAVDLDDGIPADSGTDDAADAVFQRPYLASELQARQSQNPQYTADEWVVIEADDDTPSGRVAAALDGARQVGTEARLAWRRDKTWVAVPLALGTPYYVHEEPASLTLELSATEASFTVSGPNDATEAKATVIKLGKGVKNAKALTTKLAAVRGKLSSPQHLSANVDGTVPYGTLVKVLIAVRKAGFYQIELAPAGLGHGRIGTGTGGR